jgi:HSP20 family molecular chaperone IbpA
MFFTPVTRRAACAPLTSDAAWQHLVRTSLQAAAATAADVQIRQDDKATTLQIDVPGLAREQLQISIEGARVQVRSIKGAPRQVHRVWELPQPIDATASTAKLEHGVLTLTLAHPQPQSQVVELTVH